MSVVEATRVSCSHCRLEVPAALVVEGGAGGGEQFCCPGCRAVYEAVKGCGLEGYYRLREAAEFAGGPAAVPVGKFELFDTGSFEALYVEKGSDGTASVDLFLENVSCAACVWLVEKLPEVMGGVIESRLSLSRATVRIRWDTGRVKLSEIAGTLSRFGYVPHPAKGGARLGVYRAEFRRRLIHLGIAGALAGNLMLAGAALYAGWIGGMDSGSATMLRWISLGLGLVSLSWPGGEFFRSAWGAVRARSINLDVPICIALATGGIAGTVSVVTGRGEIYFDSLAALVFLLLIGRFLQFRQQRSAESSLELLFSLTPVSCRVVGAGGDESEVPLEALVEGDVVSVRPGDVLPADGVVCAGSSSVDQALLTGESVPVRVEVGSEVFGGSQNGASPIRVRVTKAGAESRVGQLMRLLEQSLRDKPEIVRFSDRVGVAFTFAVTVVGAMVFAYWAAVSENLSPALNHTVAFLIVTCPCVLGLATPMTLAVAIGQLAKRDILVKSGGALEKLARGGRLLLDKTGTLTHGEMRVVGFSGDESVRCLIAAAERQSSHPVARALVREFEQFEADAHLRTPLSISEKSDGGLVAEFEGGVSMVLGSAEFLRRRGIGVNAVDGEGLTRVYVAVGGEHVATVGLADPVRGDSAEALRCLEGLGFVPSVVSGDSAGVVGAVAGELGIAGERAWGGVSPEGKLERVKRAEEEGAGEKGGSVVMVGDGVNDAAALAAAHVGIAVHGGSEASLAAADVYIARPGLMPVVDLVRTARKAMRVIRANFCVSLGYNLVAGYLAATGRMNPLVAAILMPLSSASVLTLAVLLMKHRGGSMRAAEVEGEASGAGDVHRTGVRATMAGVRASNVAG